MSEINPHMAIITEHGLDEEQIQSGHFQNYNMIDTFCRKDHRSGGVVIYTKKEIVCQKLNWVHNYCTEMVFEIVGTNVRLDNREIYVFGVYRSPNSKIVEFFVYLEEFLRAAIKYNTQLVIMGDLNVEIGNIAFTDILNSFNLQDLAIGPTRITKCTSKAIDHIITNVDESKLCTINNNFHISDHNAQILDIHNCYVDKIEPPYKKVRSTKISNLSMLKDRLAQETWSQVFAESDSNKKWKVFYNIFNSHFEISCPLSKKRAHIQPSPKIKLARDLIAIREKMKDYYEFFKYFKLDCYKVLYNSYKNKFKHAVNMYYKTNNSIKIASSENMTKTMWSIVNKQTKEVMKNIKILNNGQTITNPNEVCDQFNKYFLSIGGENDNKLEVNIRTSVSGSICLFDTDAKEIEYIINNF